MSTISSHDTSAPAGSTSTEAVGRSELAAVLDERGRVDEEALAQVEGRLVQDQAWPELAELYPAAAARADSADLGRRLWLSAGLLREQKLEDPSGAETWFRRVIASAPDHIPALSALARVARACDRPAEAAIVLERALAFASPELGPELALELAEVALGALGEPERALRALWMAHEMAPERPDILAKARAIFIEAERPDEAATVLVEEARVVLGPVAGDLDEDPSTATVDLDQADRDRVLELAAAHRELGTRLIDHALHHGLARELLVRARALGDDAAPDRLDALEARVEQWQVWADRARDRGLEARHKRDAASAYLEAAQLHLVYGQDSLRSDEFFERALLLQPGHEATLRVLEAVELARGGYAELLVRLNAMVASVKDPQAKVRVLCSAARVAEAEAVEAEAAGQADVLERAQSSMVDALRLAHAVVPGDREVATRLSSVLAQIGRHEARADALERFLGAAKDPDIAHETHLELGRVAAEELGDIARARVHFEAALALRPGDFEAASALRALYKDVRERPLLLGVLTTLGEHAPNIDGRLRLIEERLEVAREINREDALAAARARFELDPGVDGAEAELVELAEEFGRIESLAEAYEVAAELQTGARGAHLWRSAAQIFDQRLPRADRAARAWRRALELQPDDGEARDALERLLLNADDPRGLAEALRARVQAASSPDEVRVARAKLAEVLELRLDRVEEATAVLEAAAIDDPEDRVTLGGLAQLYARAERWGDLEGALARLEAVTSEPAALAALRVRRAQVLAAELERPDEAAELWLEVLPDHPDLAVEPLEALLAGGTDPVRIASALEPYYAARGLVARRRDVLEVLREASPDADERKRAALTSAQLSSELGDRERALGGYILALEIDPSEPTALEGIGQLMSETERGEAHCERLGAIAARTDGETRASIACLLGELKGTVLADPSGAIEAHRDALSAAPGFPAALSALDRLLSSTGRHAEHAELLEAQLLSSSSGETRVRLGHALAELRETRLGDEPGAIEAYRGVLAQAPGDPIALARLATRLPAAEAPGELLAIVDRLRDQTPDPREKAALQVRAGELLRLHLDDRAGALDRYIEAAATDPERDDAVVGLEALLEDAHLRARAGAALEPLQEARGDVAGLVRAVEAQIDAQAEASERSRRALWVAELRSDELEDVEGAFSGLLVAFERGDLPEEHWSRLIQLAERASATPRLAEAARQRAENGRAPAPTRLWAQLASRDPERASEAERAWQQVLERAPGDPEALDALERITAAGEDPRALARVLEARAEAQDDPRERSSLHRRAASIWEEAAEDLEAALAALQRARDEDASDRGLWEEMARVLGALGRPLEQAQALREEAQRTEAPISRARVFVAEARALLLVEEGGGREQAVRALERALEASPDHREARQVLESLLDGAQATRAALALEPTYRRAGDWGKLSEAYRVLAERSDDPDERVQRWIAIRSIEEERLGRAEAALEAARRAFLEAPDRLDLLDELERLSLRCGQVETLASEVLEAADRLDGDPRAELLEAATRIADTHGRDPEVAARAWRGLAEVRPHDPGVLEALADRLGSSGDVGGRVEALQVWARAQPPEAKAHGLARAAAAAEEANLPIAGQLFAEALEAQPGHPEALEGLRRTRAGEPQVLADALERAIPELDPPARGGALLALGRLQQEALESPEQALEAFSAVLGLEGADDVKDAAAHALDGLIEDSRADRPQIAARAAAAVEPHWRRTGAFHRLIQAKEARSEIAEPQQRAAVRREIAQVYEDELGRPEMAFVSLGRAFIEAPADEALASELSRLAEAAHTVEEWAELNVEALSDARDQGLRVMLARRAADLNDRVLGRPSAAVPLYERVLELAPGDVEALEALERIHRAEGAAAPLIEVLRAQLAGEELEPEARRARWGQIADLAEHEVHDVDVAAEALGELRRLDPTNVEVLRRLSALGERSDRPELAAEALEAELEKAEDPQTQARLLLQLGGLKRERLRDLSGAVEIYRRVLGLRPDDPGAVSGLASLARGAASSAVQADAAEALAPTYLRSGAYEPYLECLEWVAAGRSGDARRQCLEEIAEIYENRLGRPERAFAAARRAFHEAPADEGARARLERLAADHGLHEDLAALYLDEADASVGDQGLALTLRRRVAEIYERGLDDVPRAIGEYERILEAVPGDDDALQALERLYQKAGQSERLAEVYRRRIARADDPADRESLMRAFARLQAESLDDAPGAIATLRRLTQTHPDDRPALDSLSRLLEAEGRATELADVLERLLEIGGSDEEQLDVKVRLGRVRAERLGDLASADRLLGQALEIDPGHAGAREYLQERFEDAIADDDVALARSTGEILGRALRSSGDAAELVSVLQLRASLEPRAVDRVALEREIAQLQDEKLDAPGLAFATLADAVRAAPGVEVARDELEALAGRLGRSADLVEVYEGSLAAAPDSEVVEQLERRIAELLEPHDPSRARPAWQRVLERRPDDREALEVLDRLDTALERWAALADVLERRVELAAPGPERQQLYARLGALWDERLDEPQEAVAAYRRARAEDPEAPEVLRALSRLLDPDTETPELAEVLEALVRLEPDERAMRRERSRLAALVAGPLDDPERGIWLWLQVREDEPGHPDAGPALEELYERTGQWSELAAVLEQDLDRVRDEKEVLRRQRKLGLIRGTRLGSVDDAIASWQEILRRNPNDIESLDALRHIYREANRWEDLVSTLRKLIPLQPDAAGVKSVRFELAEVLADRLDRAEDAVESAKRVLDIEPHSPAELMRLEELFTHAGAPGEAVRVKTARAEQAETRGERVEILFEVAALYEEPLRRQAGAAGAYEQILALEPDSRKAYEGLAAIYRDTGDYRRLVELHDRRLEVVEEPESRRALLFAIVEIQERWLGHPDLAFSAACRAFAEQGADPRAREVAERLAESTSNWDLLVEVYEAQLDQVGASQAADLRRRLGEIHADRLDDADQAEQHLRVALELEPEDRGARARLRKIYEGSGRWADVVRLLGDEAEATTDPERRRALLFEIARIEASERGDAESAIRSVKRALELNPDDDAALEHLSQLFRDDGRWSSLVGVLLRRIERAPDGPSRVALQFELAEVTDNGVGDVAGAIEAYCDVLALEPDHRPSLNGLERLYTQQERWGELIEVYERRVVSATSPDEAIELLTRIAGIQEERFADLEGASKTLIRVLEVDPEHLSTVIRLERIWRSTGATEALVEALGRHVELAKTPEEASELLVEIGGLYLHQLDEAEHAEQVFLQAIEADPTHREAVHVLAELHQSRGNWFNALEMLAREVKLVGTSPEAAELHFRIGQIDDEMLGERDAATIAYERALEIDPGYAPALRALRVIREQEGGFEDAISLEAQEAEHTGDLEERARLFHHAATSALDRFDDVPKAIQFLQSGLAAEPGHVPSLEVLSDLTFSEERWGEAEQLLLRLVEQLDPAVDRAALGRLHYRLAYIAEKHGESALALERYHASYESDSTYLPTLEGLAGALSEAERWEDAQRVFQAILIQHKAALTDAEVVDVHFRIGDLALKLKQVERATKSFERALELDPNHVPTLWSFVAAEELAGRWEEAYERRERLLELLVEDEERMRALLDQARLSEDELQEPWRAIDAYAEANRIAPDDADVLRALVRLYRETSQVQKAVVALSDLGIVLTEQEARRDVYVEMARIYHEQQGNVGEAVKALNTALDVDPQHIESFSRIEQMLFDARAWPALEENYKRMLARLPKTHRKQRVVLWRSLAELYTRALRDDEGARIAYEVLHRLDPEDRDVAAQLAKVYARSATSQAEAIELYLGLLPVADDPAEPARALFNLFFDGGMLDRSFCALAALILMSAADETERRAYAGLLRYVPAGPARPLTDALWRERVLHPHCRGELATLASVVYRGAPSLFGDRQRALALKPRKERVDLGDEGKSAPAKLRYFDVWRRLQKVLHVPAADHYLRANIADPPRLIPGPTPALFVGRQNDIFTTASSRRVAWVLGRQMALARPELAVVGALDAEEVAACLEAAVRLVVPEGSGIDLGQDPEEVARWHRQLGKHMSERARVALREPALAVVENRRLKVLARFLRGVEHTANRAALLVCGDITVAAEALDESVPFVPDVSHRARVRELMLFTLGVDHFELREKVGSKVAPQAEEAVRQRS